MLWGRWSSSWLLTPTMGQLRQCIWGIHSRARRRRRLRRRGPHPLRSRKASPRQRYLPPFPASTRQAAIASFACGTLRRRFKSVSTAPATQRPTTSPSPSDDESWAFVGVRRPKASKQNAGGGRAATTEEEEGVAPAAPHPPHRCYLPQRWRRNGTPAKSRTARTPSLFCSAVGRLKINSCPSLVAEGAEESEGAQQLPMRALSLMIRRRKLLFCTTPT